jgi:hypothetical protein
VKTQKLFQYTSVALVVILLFAVGPVQGQEPEPPPEGDPAEAEYVLAQPPYTMNYQGYLTDSSGTPLDGAYDLAFRLYDADTGGNVEWGPETHNNVQVANGLFQVALGSSVALTPDVFDEALFLAVGVDGTWLTTRQPLRAVPYAFGLVPGAEVEGNPTTNYGLTVMNTGTGADDRGLYARGNQYGVWAHGVDDAGLYASSSNGTYSIRSDDTVYSSEGYAGPDTYVWVPVQNAVLDESDVSYASLSTDYYYSPLSVDAESTVISTTLVWVYIPIQVEVLYGRNYLLKNARVYYYADFDARINSARIKGCDFSGGIGVLHDIGINTTNGTSTTFAAYDIEATDYYTITASQAPTNLFISVGLPAHNSRLYLYGVRLQLESDY